MWSPARNQENDERLREAETQTAKRIGNDGGASKD